ncbi:MAG: protein translocase subunit SecD [Alcaligenaceae bacterium]|nr:protein translocase subunit SecD [Alcaligenaceae bacterium]
MNRYPLWKYILVLVVLLLSALYTIPNFYGETPAVQISSAETATKLTPKLLTTLETTLESQGIKYTNAYFETNANVGTIKIRFEDTDTQIKARDLINATLNPDPTREKYTVALNLLSATPDWMMAINAKPMALGLDLRGGVHFLLQVDMKGALDTRYDTLVTEVSAMLRSQQIPFEQVRRVGDTIETLYANEEQAKEAMNKFKYRMPELQGELLNKTLVLRLSLSELNNIQQRAISQNIMTLHNRINQLGVAEPVIQRQGSDRIVVELPGIQDVARAKDLLGRTATLQIRMVEDSAVAMASLKNGVVPFGLEKFEDSNGYPILLRRQILLTGENLENATAGRDSQSQQPTVNLSLDSKGARIFRDTTRNNIGKRMAIVLFENGHGQVVTAPVIRSEIPNGQVQISGSMDFQEATDVSLLLRAGSLAAPMSIIEERTIGPSLGADNIQKGVDSVLYGFAGVAIFMIVYYYLFGLFSTLGLAFNVLIVLAALSLLQATLTLPGIAALALTIGMAIDANVLINERIREELRVGLAPQQAINIGFDRAWATIVDSNLTSLVVGVALLIFGSGPIRGFAVVHVIGILSSMFASVVGVRSLVNLWYGRKKRLKSISIGTVWKPEDGDESIYTKTPLDHDVEEEA